MSKRKKSDKAYRKWLKQIAGDTGRVVHEETTYMTKDEYRAKKIEEQRRDDEIRKSRKCRLS